MKYYLIFVLALFSFGCNDSPEGTPEPEFTLENELELSNLILEEIFDNSSQYGTVITESDFINSYLSNVLDSILNTGKINNEEFYDWKIYLLDDSIDARIYAVPGGKVFISSATLLLMQGESEMTALLGREISYLDNGLALNQILDVYGIPLTIETFSDTNLTNIPAMADLLINSPYTAENELNGDLKSVDFLCDLSYQSDALASFYSKIESDSTNPLNKNFVFYPLDSIRINTIIEESDNRSCKGNQNYILPFQVLKDSIRKI